MREFGIDHNLLQPRGDNRGFEDLEPSNDETIERKTLSHAEKITIFITVLAILISCLSYALIHPLDKLKIKDALTDNYTVKIVYYVAGAYGTPICTETIILVDGEYIQVGSEYYRMSDDILYKYEQNKKGEWYDKRVDNITLDDIELSFDGESQGLGTVLLDKDNYHKVKGTLFVWRLNESVIEELELPTTVTVERMEGRISIVFGIFGSAYISIYKFGRTRITLPWD